jgi:hypothetical protein
MTEESYGHTKSVLRQLEATDDATAEYLREQRADTLESLAAEVDEHRKATAPHVDSVLADASHLLEAAARAHRERADADALQARVFGAGGGRR